MVQSGPYQHGDGTWDWRLYGDNESDIIATSGNQRYENHADCLEMYNKIIGGHYADKVIPS